METHRLILYNAIDMLMMKSPMKNNQDRLPMQVLILEPNKMLQPSYLQTNEEGFDPVRLQTFNQFFNKTVAYDK